MLFSLCFSAEILLTLVILLRMVNPLINLYFIGIPFLLLLPALPILAPFWCILAIAFGSSTMLKSYSNMNATMLKINYPLTLIMMLIRRENTFYIMILILLVFNKALLSFLGSKVRQHFANPDYSKNQMTSEDLLRNMVVATSAKLLKSA